MLSPAATATNQQLVNLLGIPPMAATVDIHLRHDNIPMATISCYLPGGSIGDAQLFELHPIGPPPALDLDAMCSAARARLARKVAADAERAKDEVENSFRWAKYRMGFPVYKNIFRDGLAIRYIHEDRDHYIPTHRDEIDGWPA